MSMGARERKARPRLRTGWSLCCAALLLLAVALGPALRERAERRRLDEADARAVGLQVDALRLRLARARGELRDWGADLLLGRVGAPDARRAATALIAELPELRALERVDTELALHDAWPAPRRRAPAGSALPSGPARDAAERALRSGFPASTPVFEVPGDGPSVTTWVPVLDGERVIGLVGGSFALDALLHALHTPGGAHARLELVDASGALLAAVGEPPRGDASRAVGGALQPFGLPLRLVLRRERAAPAALPSALTGLALLVALGLVAQVLRRRFAALPTPEPAAPRTTPADDALRFVSGSPAALAVFGRDRRCLAGSARWRAWLGLRASAELVGRPFHALLPGGAAHWSGVFERGLRGAREQRAGERITLASGRRVRLSWILEPWLDAHGRVGGVCLLLEALEPAEVAAGELPVAGRRAAANAGASSVAARAHGAGANGALSASGAAGANGSAAASPSAAWPTHALSAGDARTLDVDAANHAPPLPADGVTDELHADARAALRDLRRAQAALALGEHDAAAWHDRALAVSSATKLAADVAFLERERAGATGHVDAASNGHADAAANGAQAHDIDVAHDAASAARGRVLVAEPDPAARALAARVLASQRYEVVPADDARAALEALRSDPSDVLCVLLALDLPGRDPLALLHEMRRLRADLPVLLVQPPGLARPPRPEERDGCALLRRPYRAAQLLRACRLAVARRAARGRSFLPSGGVG